MEIEVNGKKISLAENSTVADALNHIGIIPKGIAVAINQQVVKASNFPTTHLKDGDKLMIIKAFYGG